MQKLVSELSRLYIAEGSIAAAVLSQRMAGLSGDDIRLARREGATRAILLPFKKMADGDDSRHWTRLCEVANALQTELGLPAPAVSISSSDGFGLWLSLAEPAAAASVRQFIALVHAAYCADIEPFPETIDCALALPPCLDEATGKWAAFINPGLGASFADESGLEMAPPLAGQCALLEGLHSITAAQFAHAIDVLRRAHGSGEAVASEAPLPRAAPEGLLLRDATLEDIVNHLHAINIEPTFRHLIKR